MQKLIAQNQLGFSQLLYNMENTEPYLLSQYLKNIRIHLMWCHPFKINVTSLKIKLSSYVA